MIGLM